MKGITEIRYESFTLFAQRSTFLDVRLVTCLYTMKNFYITREIYGIYIRNLTETSRRNNY